MPLRSHTLRFSSLLIAAATAPLLSLSPTVRAQDVASSATRPPDQASAQSSTTSSTQSTTQSVTQPSTDLAELEQRLEADERRLRELERRLHEQQHHEQQHAAPKQSAVAQWGPKGFAIASADGSNVLKLGALIQADGR